MFDRLHRVLIAVGVIFIGGIAGLSFLQIICRYVFGASLLWSNDLTQIMMMWMVMMTAGAMLWRGSHFTLLFVTDRLPGGIQRTIRIATGAILALFAVFLVITGMQLALSQTSQLVPALGITYFYVYLAMPIGACFIFVFAIGIAWRELCHRAEAPDEPGNPA